MEAVLSTCEHHEQQAKTLERIEHRLEQLCRPPQRTIRVFQNAISAGTTIEIDTDPVPVGYYWWVELAVYSCNSVSQTAASLYLDAPDPLELVDFTTVGNGSPSGQAQPLYVPGGTRLVAVWTGATAPAIARLRLQYRVEPAL